MDKHQSQKTLLDSNPPDLFKGKVKSGSKKRGKRKVTVYKEGPAVKEVNSKIENTKPAVNRNSKISDSLKSYRVNVKVAGQLLAKEAIRITDNNLLSAKMGLWEAIKVVEDKMRENKS